MEPSNAIACWWPCFCWKCVAGLRRLEKTGTFGDAYKFCSWCSSDVQTLMKEKGYTHLYGHWLGEDSCTVNWNEFFFVCGSGIRLKFSCIALFLKRLHLGSKTDLTTNGFIFKFFVELCRLLSSSYLHGLKSVRIAHLCFSFDDIQSFR